MQSLPIIDILVSSERQRTSIDDSTLSALCDSILSIGVLHPIVVRQTEKGPTLVAGERRLRAIENLAILGKRIRAFGTLLPEGHAPVTDIGTLDPLGTFEAELEENIRRVDLSWQDRTAAEARLVDLRRQQAEARGEKFSLNTVGAELAPNQAPDYQRDKVRQSVILQDAIKSNPAIAKAATQKEAWKLLKRQEQGKKDEVLGAAIGKRSARDLFEVRNEDCRTFLASTDSTFDCILIDPPYGMGADQFGDAAGRNVGIEHGYDDSGRAAMSLMREIAPKLFAVGAEQAHLYVWCDLDGFHELRRIFSETGWWVHRTPLINIKREGGRVPWPEHGPRRCYELVLYAVKGKKPVTAIYRDVFESTLERDSDGHGAAKPVEAYVNLLQRSCRPGDSVLDCFAGTGTILAAAAQLKLRATAVELDPSYYGQCVRRLESLGQQK